MAMGVAGGAGDARRERMLSALALGVVLLALAGCGHGRHAAPSDVTTTRGAATPGTTLPVGTTSTARPLPRVVVVVEENHSLGQILGSPDAPFLNELAAHGTLLTSYDAVAHPSLPNYLAMVGGDTFGIASDCGSCHVGAPSLADQLDTAGISWKAYMQGLPAPCSDVVSAGAYAKKHDPFMYFDRVRDSPSRCAKVVPFEQLATDLAAGRLPRFAFVSPDLDHDMHDGSVRTADGWLRDLAAALRASPAWRQNARLVVTFDEGSGDNRVFTVVTGSRVPAGRDATPYTHYSLLRSIEELFGLPALGHAGDRSTPAIPALAHPARS
jgi:hypothetical protein